jgi:hypothetical protein
VVVIVFNFSYYVALRMMLCTADAPPPRSNRSRHPHNANSLGPPSSVRNSDSTCAAPGPFLLTTCWWHICCRMRCLLALGLW